MQSTKCVSRCEPETKYLFNIYISVDRFTPHVIANIFFGHTHEDQFSVRSVASSRHCRSERLQIFYANNATNISAETAGAVFWVCTNLSVIVMETFTDLGTGRT